MNKVTQAYKVNSTKKINRTSKVKNEKDSLAISDFAKELQTAKNAVNLAPDVRTEKIDAIKKKIASGAYNVSASEVADKIVENYFDKKI